MRSVGHGCGTGDQSTFFVAACVKHDPPTFTVTVMLAIG
jgi:hypothetical protein